MAFLLADLKWPEGTLRAPKGKDRECVCVCVHAHAHTYVCVSHLSPSAYKVTRIQSWGLYLEDFSNPSYFPKAPVLKIIARLGFYCQYFTREIKFQHMKSCVDLREIVKLYPSHCHISIDPKSLLGEVLTHRKVFFTVFRLPPLGQCILPIKKISSLNL